MTVTSFNHDKLSLMNDKLTFINKDPQPDDKLVTSLPLRSTEPEQEMVSRCRII